MLHPRLLAPASCRAPLRAFLLALVLGLAGPAAAQAVVPFPHEPSHLDTLRLAPEELRPLLSEAELARYLPTRRLRIRAVGDVMLGTDFPDAGYLPPGDANVLAAVAELLADADLTFANLEGPFLDGGATQKCGEREGSTCYAFRTPTRYGGYLREAGIRLASLANNHARDFGEEGREATVALLDSLGIHWSGPAGTYASLRKNGLDVAMIAFHTAEHSNFLNDEAGAAEAVARLAEGHDVVIVSFHGGAEGGGRTRVPHGREFFLGEDRGDLRRFARTVVDAGADLVIGHGPHVPRGLELYRGRLVAYSLGNFATYGRFNLRGASGLAPILEVELGRDGRFLGGRILSARQVGRGVPEPDPTRAAALLMRRLSREDFPDSEAEILPDGSILPPAKAGFSTPQGTF